MASELRGELVRVAEQLYWHPVLGEVFMNDAFCAGFSLVVLSEVALYWMLPLAAVDPRRKLAYVFDRCLIIFALSPLSMWNRSLEWQREPSLATLTGLWFALHFALVSTLYAIDDSLERAASARRDARDRHSLLALVVFGFCALASVAVYDLGVHLPRPQFFAVFFEHLQTAFHATLVVVRALTPPGAADDGTRHATRVCTAAAGFFRMLQCASITYYGFGVNGRLIALTFSVLVGREAKKIKQYVIDALRYLEDF